MPEAAPPLRAGDPSATPATARDYVQHGEFHRPSGQDQVPGFVVRLAEVVCNVVTATADFPTIAPGYRHLHLVCMMRGTVAATFVGVQLAFNGDDSGTNYDIIGISMADNLAPATTGVFGLNAFVTGTCAAANATAGIFDTLDALIPNYANTIAQKTALTRSSSKIGVAAGNLVFDERHAWWRNTAAITRITVSPQSGSWAAGTIVSLYGMS